MADRRAANAGSRFGGPPSNEASYGTALRTGAPPADADADPRDDPGAEPEAEAGAERGDGPEHEDGSERGIEARSEVDDAPAEAGRGVEARSEPDARRAAGAPVGDDGAPGGPERPLDAAEDLPVGDVVEDDETDLADAAQMVDEPVEEDADSRVAPDAEDAYDDGAYDYEHDRDQAVDRARQATDQHGTEVDWFAPAAAAAAAGAGAPAPPDEYDYDYGPAWNRPSGVSPITRGERRAIEAAAVSEAKAGAGLDRGFGQVVFALLRLVLGFVFLWAFLDKLFGFGRGTARADAWREGGSPTTAYLSSVDGPAAGFFNELAGRSWVDWLFMIGLAAIGVALILGIGLTITAIASTVLLGMMYASSLPIASNPFVDDHIIYALIIIGIAATGAGLRYSLAPWWRRTRLVKALRFLR